jgi:hypothetical protein
MEDALLFRERMELRARPARVEPGGIVPVTMAVPGIARSGVLRGEGAGGKAK